MWRRRRRKPNFQGRVILGGLATTFLVGGCTLYRFAGKLGLVVAFGGFFLAVLCTIVAVMLPRRR
jgi:heme A synthase